MFGRLLWRSLRARRGRVLLALLAVALGAGMATTLATLALQVGDDVALALRAAGPNFLLQPAGADWTPELGATGISAARATASLPDSSVAMLRRSFWKNNILAAAPELEIPVGFDSGTATLVGTWFDTELGSDQDPWRTGLGSLHPTWRLEGRWPAQGSTEVALGRDLARRLNASPGSTLALRAGHAPLVLAVTGVVDAGGPDDGGGWIDLELAQRIAARPRQIDRLQLSALLKPGPVAPPPDPKHDPAGYERYMCTAYPSVVAADLTELIPGIEVVPATERIAGEAYIVRRLTLLMVLLTLAALAASTLGLLSTTTATVAERTPEIALLRAVGASPTQLATLMLGETVCVSLAGGAAGWVIGSLAAALLRGGGFTGGGAFHGLLLPVALAIALGVGVAGTWAPLRMALRVDPARVLRG